MSLWSQLLATALLMPTLASIMVLYGLGIIIVPEFARATIREAPAIVVRGTNAIVEGAIDLLPKSNPVAETTPPSPPPPSTKVTERVAFASLPDAQLVSPQPDPDTLKIAQRPGSVESYGPPVPVAPEPPHRSLESRTRTAQNLPRDFGFADTGGSVAEDSRAFEGNSKAKGAFIAVTVETSKAVEGAKPATPAPSPPKIADVVVPLVPDVPPPPAVSKAAHTQIITIDVPPAPDVAPAKVSLLLTSERVETVIVEKSRPVPAIEPPEVASLSSAAPSPPTPAPDSAADRLFERASDYVKLNDFNTARLFLTRASDAGHVPATLALAEMYDPEKKSPPGITPDAAKAKALYEKARLRQ